MAKIFLNRKVSDLNVLWENFAKIQDKINNDPIGGGADGQSAYELAVALGYVGSPADWIISLQGLDGTNGSNGTNGVNGKSAYEVAVSNGFIGTEPAWLLSLKGATGPAGSPTLTDLSATSTIVGWASFTKKFIKSSKIGNMVTIAFFIAGTSNSADASFTIPSVAMTGLDEQWLGIKVTSSTSTTPGYAVATSGSSVITLTRNFLAGSWNASLYKEAQGVITFMVN